MPDETPEVPFVPPKTIAPPSIAPQITPKEPPKEVLEREFKMDESMFSDEPGTNNIQAPIQLPPTKKEDKKKEEPKIESPKADTISGKERSGKGDTSDKGDDKTGSGSVLKPPAKKEEVKVEPKKEEPKKEEPKQEPQSVLKAPGQQSRDYSGFSEQEQTILKQMSNEAFDFTTKAIKENREIKQKGDNQYFQHPEAYKLSPEYQNLQLEARGTEIEAQVWEDMLLKAVRGESIKNFLGVDRNTLQPVYDEKEIKPDDRIIEQLRGYVLTAKQAANERRNKLGQYGPAFKNRIDTDTKMIHEERRKNFSWIDKPEMLEYSVPINFPDKGWVDVPLKQVKEQFMTLVPPYMRGTILADTLSDFFVQRAIDLATIHQLRQGKTVADVKLEEAKNQEPSSGIRPIPDNTPSIGKNKIKEFSASGMPD